MTRILWSSTWTTQVRTTNLGWLRTLMGKILSGKACRRAWPWILSRITKCWKRTLSCASTWPFRRRRRWSRVCARTRRSRNILTSLSSWKRQILPSTTTLRKLLDKVASAKSTESSVNPMTNYLRWSESRTSPQPKSKQSSTKQVWSHILRAKRWSSASICTIGETRSSLSWSSWTMDRWPKCALTTTRTTRKTSADTPFTRLRKDC